MSTSGLPEEAYAVALAMEPDVGPSTLRRLLDGKRPSEAWAWAHRDAGSGGAHGDGEVAARWERHLRLGVTVLRPEHPSYPRRLFEDPQAPAVLFCLGDVAALNGGATAASGGHASADPLRDRRGGAVRCGLVGSRRERRVGSGPRDRRGGP